MESVYARWAPIYDRTFGWATDATRRRGTDYVNALPAGDLLEVGVGTGLALPHYKDHLKVTGIDYSADMLVRAEERVAERGLTNIAALRRMDARALEFDDAQFDYVVSMHVLSVVPEPQRVMSEIARVLRPGGSAVITVHVKRDSAGAMAALERALAPLANRIGWHSDFDRSALFGDPRLSLEHEDTLPPLGLMSFLVLRRQRG